MTKLKPYPKYKDSGIAWIGAVPEGWEVIPFFSAASESKINNKGMVEDNLLSLSYGNIVRRNINTNEGLLPESFETYQIVEKDNIVFRLTDLQNDQRSLRSAIVKERGIITSAYIAVSIKHAYMPDFFNYLFRAYDALKVFYGMGAGLRQSLKYDDLKRISVLAPPLPEQQTIAAYLDSETAQIDALIAKKTRSIELLREKRQAMITHAVTKGLNPNAKMKDSGIEWIGDVPEGWEVKRIKNVILQNKNGIKIGPFGSALKNRTLPDGEYKIYNQAHVIGDNFDLNRHFVDEATFKELLAYEVEPCDILLTMMGTIGKCKIMPNGKKRGIMDSHLIKVKLGKNILPRFFEYSYDKDNSYIGIFQLQYNSVGITMSGLNSEIVKNVYFSLPSLPEQQAIAAYLDDNCAKIDTLITKTERSIELLKEKRQALISAAVTGKIDVREDAPEAVCC